jgi:hypothetical protein
VQHWRKTSYVGPVFCCANYGCCMSLMLWVYRWRFAYRCVVAEEVKRIHNMWSWKHIREHRKVFHKYLELYKNKLHGRFAIVHSFEIEVVRQYLHFSHVAIWNKAIASRLFCWLLPARDVIWYQRTCWTQSVKYCWIKVDMLFFLQVLGGWKNFALLVFVNVRDALTCHCFASVFFVNTNTRAW